MSRRLLWPLVVVALIAAAPRSAAAQNCIPFSGSQPCGWSVAGPWRSVSFGEQTFAPAPSSPWRTSAGHATHQFVQPSAESPWRWAPTQSPILTHRTHGDLGRMPVGMLTGVPPIDCDMAKPGNPTLDPKIIQPPPRLTHSGVVIPVAPCKKK